MLRLSLVEVNFKVVKSYASPNFSKHFEMKCSRRIARGVAEVRVPVLFRNLEKSVVLICSRSLLLFKRLYPRMRKA